jgi:hypothetical protein
MGALEVSAIAAPFIVREICESRLDELGLIAEELAELLDPERMSGEG